MQRKVECRFALVGDGEEGGVGEERGALVRDIRSKRLDWNEDFRRTMGAEDRDTVRDFAPGAVARDYLRIPNEVLTKPGVQVARRRTVMPVAMSPAWPR